MKLLHQKGSLYVTKRSPPGVRSWPQADSVCKNLNAKRYGNLKSWRLPSSSELKRVAGGKGLYWVSTRSTLYDLRSGRESKNPPLAGATALCVAKK
jgi:hypothetical protein